MDSSNFDKVYLTAFGLLIFVRILICVRNSYDRRYGSRDTHDRPLGITVVSTYDRPLQHPEERREHILTNLITKMYSKDLYLTDLEKGGVNTSSDMKKISSSGDGNDSLNSSGDEKSTSKEDSTTEDESSNSDDNVDQNSNSDSIQNDQMYNNLVDTIDSIFSNVNQTFRRLNSNLNDESSSSEKYSPNSCSICLEPYKANEEICFSTNKACQHSFHLDCMVSWLMAHNDCPLCRQNYLTNSSQTEES